ncbi:MAG: glycosyltransferase family 4 protein [Verrucomicrobia subdivision 3 bacterium]|nr:glycosyltransferase family 4 protein [Limisphaerales bacterium]
MKQSDALLAKRMARRIYGGLCGARVWANGLASGSRKIAVHYGGARADGAGGPRVKVRRLREHFPEAGWRFNLIYSLSSAPHLSGAALARLRRRGTPIVHNQNGTFYPAWFGGDWRAENRRMARAFHAANHVFFQSEYCRRAAHKHLGVRDGAGEVLHNAVDTSRFAPTESPPTGGPVRFLVTGRFGHHHRYRLEVAVAGLRAARDAGLDAHLTVAGQFDSKTLLEIRQQIDALDLQKFVKISGPYSQVEAPDVNRSADVFLLTTHQDACPNAVLEAMACGLPVLFSANGGVPELVGTEAGVGLESPEDWDTPHPPTAEAMGEGMLKIAEQRKTMGQAARARAVERFDIQPWIQRHREVFEQLLK